MTVARALQAGAAAAAFVVAVAPAASAATTGQATNPVVTITTSCSSGMSVVLSNIAPDDSATDSVTFSVALPGGSVDSVLVRADQIKKRTYTVPQVAAGTVTVSAPGMSPKTASYAKSCTKVLGEKVTRPVRKATPAAPTLPFTGGREAPLALLGAGLAAAGVVLLRIGRRRVS